MRPLTAGLEAHIRGPATTLCHAWKLTRRDGLVLGFTDHDQKLEFDGVVFSAASGFQASEVESATGLSVGNGEVAGAFASDAISESDLREGRYDGATIEVYAVNWAAPDERVLRHSHVLGEVSIAGGAFRAELRGLAHRLDRMSGRVYGRRCDADLGDARCRVAVKGAVFSTTAAVVSVPAADQILVDGLNAYADGWFAHGLLQWTTGANAGLSVEILEHRKEPGRAMLTLWAEPANRPVAGDAFTIIAGCDKSFSTCKGKFANELNFRGFPHMPGGDFAFGYVDQQAVHDGRPVMP
jgi:uncharacterized phage protein (TIGR02218 family)